MNEMNLCSECDRHVYADEPACPFCGSSAPRRAIPRGGSRGRLSRAAAHAARAAVLVGAMGCSSSTTPEADASSDAPTDAPVDAVTEDAVPADAVAMDAMPDAGPPDGAPLDVSPDAEDADVPLYGGVFPDPRLRAVV